MPKTFSAQQLRLNNVILSGSGNNLFYGGYKILTGLEDSALASTSFTAGSGLVGGGNFSASRTFDVGAGSGIYVSADAIHINTAGVVSAMINDGAVTESKIDSLAVTAGKIGSNAVETAKINALAVTEAKIAPSAVTTAKINDGAVTNAKLASNFAGSSSQGGAANSVVGSLSNGEGIISLSYNGSAAGTVRVDTSVVVMTSGVQTIAGNKTFSNNITIDGNLTVAGTTTAINSNEVNIGDSKIVLNSDATTGTAADGGIQVYTGVASSPELLWRQSNKNWSQSSNGSDYYELVSSLKQRVGTQALSTDDISKTISFGHTFPATPVVTAILQASTAEADIIAVQVSNISTTEAIFQFTAPIPSTATYTLNWHALSSVS